MPSRTMPGVGLKADWDEGEDGWKDENDTNLLIASVLMGARVLSIVAAEPGAPTEGDIHILDETHATHANEIAVYDEAAWKYFPAGEGVILKNLDDGAFYTFDGTTWIPFTAGFSFEVLPDQATYDALDPPDPDTFYFIEEEL